MESYLSSQSTVRLGLFVVNLLASALGHQDPGDVAALEALCLLRAKPLTQEVHLRVGPYHLQTSLVTTTSK